MAQPIDLKTWDRREHYELFSAQKFPYLGGDIPGGRDRTAPLV